MALFFSRVPTQFRSLIIANARGDFQHNHLWKKKYKNHPFGQLTKFYGLLHFLHSSFYIFIAGKRGYWS